MHKLIEIKDMLMEELEKCANKGELSAGSLDIVDKLTHSIKSIDTILAMEDAGYSYDDYSYGRGRNARRDSMGRYSRDTHPYYDNTRTLYGRRYDRYSRDRSDLVDELKELEMSMTDEETKRMLHKFIKQAEENA